MKMISFAELTKQVHLINDLILSDMICDLPMKQRVTICAGEGFVEDRDRWRRMGETYAQQWDEIDNDETADVAGSFSKHLLATKYWFARISWANKKRYLLALLQDVRSAWTLSLLLKSMWNCRPKDAVLSVSEQNLWSSYDQVPLDHNRTALPVPTLAQVMKNDRFWFLSLEPESQALVLSELLTVAGGPVMWEVLRRAHVLYDRYREQMMHNLHECIVVNETPVEKDQSSPHVTEKVKKDPKSPVGASAANINQETGNAMGNAQKELDANLAAWNATIKGMRDSLKLEELEMTFNDGTKRKIWKVNRPKPEVIETVDFIQLLPSAIGKRILSYLPRLQLSDYAKVNKYWAWLVDEYRAELTARQKINADFDKLNDMLLRHDTSLDVIDHIDMPPGPASSQAISIAPSARLRQPPASMRASEKSGGAYSLRHFISDKLNRPLIVQKPIRNMADLTERLERRGAADENLFKWCESILKHTSKSMNTKRDGDEEGVLKLGNVHFPCPLMKLTLEVPLYPPLYKDPALTASTKPRRNISNATLLHIPKEPETKRYSLWTRDLSSLYPVFKIPSYISPI